MKQLRDIRVSQILKSARDIVAERWAKGFYVSGPNGENKTDISKSFGIPDYDNDDWGYCGDGALRRSIKNQMKQFKEIERNSQAEHLLHEAQKALVQPILRRMTHEQTVEAPMRSHQKIWYFNDLPEVNQETMLEIYDEAIEESCRKVRENAGKEGEEK